MYTKLMGQMLPHVLNHIKRHKRRLLFIGIPIIILIIIFWPRPPKPLETETVKKTDITESISTTGTVTAKSSVNLTFLSGGKLSYLGVKKGDHVKTGQTIATLDQRTVQKNLETQLRAYAEQRNTFEQTKKDNQNRTINEALDDSMRQILQNNQYDLEDAVASVELQELAKQQAVLTTPIAGIVTRADVVSTGVNITATTTFTVADPNNIFFQMDIDEADIGTIKEGQPVNVTLDSYPDATIPLQIDSIDFQSHESDTGGNVYTAEAKMPENSNLSYRLGMSGDAEIIIEKKQQVLVVSLASLTDDESVYVKKGNNFEKRKIKTGIQSDIEIEVLSGLSEGEIVALQPDEAEKRVKK